MEVLQHWTEEEVVGGGVMEVDDFPSTPLVLGRAITDDGIQSISFHTETQDQEQELDAMLQALEDELSSEGNREGFSSEEEEDHPQAVAYSSSDETHSTNDVHSIPSSSSLGSENCEELTGKPEKRKRAPPTKRAAAGLSAQEKRELRKLRNRELAAESRKRKNDEMDRLRVENGELKQRIAELERLLGGQSKGTVASKRSRTGMAVSTSVAVASLTAFVVTAPSDANSGVTGSASVLVTALDSVDGRLQAMAQLLFTCLMGMVLLLLLRGKARAGWQSLRTMKPAASLFSSRTEASLKACSN